MNTIFGKICFSVLIVLGLVNPLFGQAPEGEGALPGEEEVFSPEVDEPPPPPPIVPSAPSQPPAGSPPAAGAPPTAPTMEAAAPAATAETTPPAESEEEMVYLNVNDQDIKEVIKQISKATNRNFIIDAKVTGKVTILSNRMMTKAEAYQAFLSALEVAGFTTYSGPGGIIKIIPLRDAKNYPIPTHVDTTPYTDNYVTRLIKLENISADDMAEAIKGLISRNGNLFAYSETNTLVITDSGTNIDRLMKIIKELDQEGPQEVVEIIPIHFASAKELSGIVLSLYEQQARAGGRRGEGGGAEMAQVSKIIADERTNSIIVLASKRAIDKVKELINKLDAKLEEGQEGKIHVHYLRYAKAKDLVTVLQGLAGQAAKSPAQGGAQQGAVIAELEDFKIASDDGTNSLLITATPKTYMTLVDKVINKLDIPRKQVYLEAMVIEFFLSRKKELGISGHGGAVAGNMVGFGSTFKQLIGLFDPFSAASAGSAFINSPGLLGGILARRTVDLKVTGTDGATKTVTIPAFSAFLTALNTFGDTNLVASPNLLALDNEEASIEIIRKEPEPGQNVLSATGALQVGKPERIEAGLRLKLTPQVTERGTVRMKIDQQFSSFSPAKNPALGTQAIVERKVSTSVVTNDGQTVVIGGLMEDQQTVEKKKLPVLGDIPLLGFLFQQSVANRSKSNLLLFITPHIIRDSSDFDKVLKRKIGEQKEFINKHYKPNQRKKVVGIIEEHHKGFFDVLNEITQEIPAEAEASGVSTERASSAPVITASPDQESRVTIILPPSGSEPPVENVEAPKKKKKKQVEAPPPPPATVSQPIVLQPAPQPLAPQPMAAPPPSAKQEALASPPPPPPAATSGHAPVITLPPGSTPDLED